MVIKPWGYGIWELIQQQLDVPGSTLSHHLSGLVSAGLLSQRREGRTLYCVADYAQLEAVTDTLLLAMHDLRSMLVKRKADRLGKGE